MKQITRHAGWLPKVGLAALFIGAAVFPAFAQAPPTQPAAAPAEPPKWPDFNTTIKDMQATPGLFTLYRYKPDDPSKDQSRLLCQIPRSLMRQDMLLAISYSRGAMAGFMGDDYLVRFEMVGRQVVIAVPDSRYIQTPGQPITDAVSRTYVESYLASMPIITMAPGGDPVVDLGTALMNPGVGAPSQGMGGGPRRDLSEYTKLKVFPENALIDINLVMGNRSGGGQAVGISYAFRRLPDAKAYQPRIADERVGYFTTVRQDWNMKYFEKENIVRYVNRWDIKKKDPSLEMSPPDKPIVFIIEKTVPLQWRRYVYDGISEWNKSFEKIGIVGAVVVQQQTEDNEFANVDPEDARYNFIRWIVTGQAFAMGPSRADPRTGQLLDADIIFDDSMVRVWSEDFDTFGPKAATAIIGPELPKFLTENPQFIPAGQTLEQVKAAATAVTGELMYDTSRDAFQSEPLSNRHGPMRFFTACNYATGIKHQLAMAQLAVAASAPGKKIPERFIGEVIKEVTSHEVGHTLGLRHNFKASSWLSIDEIKRRRDNTDEPTFGSVMDYNPILFFAGDDPTKLRHFQSPCIGPYDHWAIEYGYKQPGKEDGDEKTMLSKIAAQGTKREYAYATDEDTMGFSSVDPYSNRFDMSDDLLGWARSRIDLCDTLLKDLKTWAVKKDEPNYYLRRTFLTLMSEKSQNMIYVSRIAGGQTFNRNRPGDPEAKPALVLMDPAKQREAIKMLGETIFRDDFFATEASLFNELSPSRWWDWASAPSSRVDFAAHDIITSLQAYTLMSLCTPQVLQRVYDAELKSKADDKFTAAELVISVRDQVWGNLTLVDDAKFTDAQPMISSVRRNLQKQHMQYLLATADTQGGRLVSPDLQSTVRFALRELSDQIGAVLEKAKSGANASRIDFATRAHLTESRSQIDRVLNAPHIRMPNTQVLILSSLGDGQAQPRQAQQETQPRE